MTLIVCCQMRIQPLKSTSLISLNVSLLLAKISANTPLWLGLLALNAYPGAIQSRNRAQKFKNLCSFDEHLCRNDCESL